MALLRFDYGVTPFAGSSTTVSRNPLLEWHSFANVPAPGRNGFRLTVSRAGDWTGSFIDDGPSHLWVKGITDGRRRQHRDAVHAGRLRGHRQRHRPLPAAPAGPRDAVPAGLGDPRPRTTYGDELVDEILAVQPDAVIWDTDAKGKPDLVALAYPAYVDFDAEAIICISNKKTTWHLVEHLRCGVSPRTERSGIPDLTARDLWRTIHGFPNTDGRRQC